MKREEQIEKARELLACGALSKEACDAIKADFPELAESEDEKTRKEIISFIEYEEARGNIPDGWHQAKRPGEWIAYLEKQKEQKPAEWSEEDRDRVAQYLRDRNKKMLWPEAEKITNDILDRLRPQPHWRPSEEQMYALKDAIETYRVRHNASTSGDNVFKGLESLYSDIKKLH